MPIGSLRSQEAGLCPMVSPTGPGRLPRNGQPVAGGDNHLRFALHETGGGQQKLAPWRIDPTFTEAADRDTRAVDVEDFGIAEPGRREQHEAQRVRWPRGEPGRPDRQSARTRRLRVDQDVTNRGTGPSIVVSCSNLASPAHSGQLRSI